MKPLLLSLIAVTLLFTSGCNENTTVNGIEVQRLFESDTQIADKIQTNVYEYINKINKSKYSIQSISFSQGIAIVVLNKINTESMTTKEKALSKLTDEEKSALNLK